MKKLNISELYKQEGEQLEFSEDLDNFQVDEFEITCVNIEGVVTNNSGRLEFDAQISALAKAPCSRCLSEVCFPLKVEISENLSDSLDNLDAIYYNNHAVDLAEVAEEMLSLELPMTVHCGKEDCVCEAQSEPNV